MQPLLRPSTPLFLARKAAVVYQFGWMIHLNGGVWLMYLLYGGDALEHDDDHVSINGSVVAVDDRLVVIHHFGMSSLERAQWHHVQVRLEAFEFGGFCVGSVVSSMGRVVGGDLT